MKQMPDDDDSEDDYDWCVDEMIEEFDLNLRLTQWYIF